MDKDDPATVPLRDFIEMRFSQLEANIVTAKTELDRRLGELNKLRSDVIEDRRVLVSMDTYSANELSRTSWRESTMKNLAELGIRLTVIETRSVTWTAALGLFFTLLQLSIGGLLYWLMHIVPR